MPFCDNKRIIMQLQDYQKAWMRQKITDQIGELLVRISQLNLSHTTLQIFVDILNVNDPYPHAEADVPKNGFCILQHRLWGILHADLPTLESCYIINNSRDPIRLLPDQFQALVWEIKQTARNLFWQILGKQNLGLKQQLEQYLTSMYPSILASQLFLLVPPTTEQHFLADIQLFFTKMEHNKPLSPPPQST